MVDVVVDILSVAGAVVLIGVVAWLFDALFGGDDAE